MNDYHDFLVGSEPGVSLDNTHGYREQTSGYRCGEGEGAGKIGVGD